MREARHGAAAPAHPSSEATLGKRRRSRRPPPREEGEPRVNEQIGISHVLLIDQHGEALGEFPTEDALQMARDVGLDLVEVAPNARPPVCRLTDYGRLRYEKQKQESAARKRRHQVQVKEIKVRPKTDDHDMSVKIKRARKFLQNGDKVKVVVWFRGREHAHHDIGADQCFRVADACDTLGEIEKPPSMDGRRMTMILSPSAEAVAK